MAIVKFDTYLFYLTHIFLKLKLQGYIVRCKRQSKFFSTTIVVDTINKEKHNFIKSINSFYNDTSEIIFTQIIYNNCTLQLCYEVCFR